MLHKKVVKWILGLSLQLRLSQRKTLAELVYGAVKCRRVSLADIGRSLGTDALAKHSIKRVWRFLKNYRVCVAEGCRGLVRMAAKAAGGRLFVAVDWVDIGKYKVLRAAVPLRGRSVPILFGAYRKWRFYKSQNNLEEGLLRLLAALLSGKTQVVIIADRGFGRAELARTLQEIGFGYVIRVNSQVAFRSRRYSGRLDELGIRSGMRRDLGFGLFRKMRPVTQRVLMYWGKRKAEPWFLATNLEWGWKKILFAYSRRMSIEELFRDEKNIRYGWGLRQFRVSSPERLERMLLVLAYAYLLLLLMGVMCQESYSQAHWSSAVGRRRQSSAFVIGRYMINKEKLCIKLLLRLLTTLLIQLVEENWG